jgi:hypothetical protein
MSAQGKINSLKAGTAGVEVMQWAVRELQELSNLVQLLRVGQPNIDYDKELLKPTFVGRELTDEEIEDALYVSDITLENLSDGDIPMERIKAFAKAILRKAQEI